MVEKVVTNKQDLHWTTDWKQTGKKLSKAKQSKAKQSKAKKIKANQSKGSHAILHHHDTNLQTQAFLLVDKTRAHKAKTCTLASRWKVC